MTKDRFVTEKGYFELADNKTSIKILKDGFYRVKCQFLVYSDSSYIAQLYVKIDDTNAARLYNQAYPNVTQVYCTMTSDVVHELKANQKIRFYTPNKVNQTLYDNDVYIERLL